MVNNNSSSNNKTATSFGIRMGGSSTKQINTVILLGLLTLSSLSLSAFLIRNSTQESLAKQLLLPANQQSISQHRRQTFDPFSDFAFRTVNQTQNPEDTNIEQEYFSSYHCVSTGSQFNGNSQSERLSYNGQRPNFSNRQCHYKNLYYRISDQTFHYLASPKETKVWKEARKADAEIMGSIESELKHQLTEDQDQLIQHHLKLQGGVNRTMIVNQLQKNIEHYKENSFPRLFSSYMEIINRMNVQIGHALKYDVMPSDPWRPIVHEHDRSEDLWGTIESSSFAIVDIKSNQDAGEDVVKDFYMTLYRPSHSMNIGHLLWDDVYTIYGLYDRLIDQNNNKSPSDDQDLIVPFFVELPDARRNRNYGGHDKLWRCSPGNHVKWEKCRKMYMRVFQDFTGVAVDRCSGDLLRTGNWLRGDEPIGVWRGHAKNDTCLGNRTEDRYKLHAHMNRNRLVDEQNKDPTNVDLVMLPNVLAGGGRMGFIACKGDCAIGRSQQNYRFRNYLIDNILLAEKDKVNGEGIKTTTKPHGYIVFSLPFGSSRPKYVYDFQEEIQECIRIHGADLVKVVELPKMTIQDQVRLLEETALLITNHGGIASASIFLPRGSSAIVYWHGEVKYDHQWFESTGYFRSVFIGVEERPFLNRTMAILDDELEKTRMEWAFHQKEEQ